MEWDNMGNTAVIPPPPAGFTPIDSGSSIPPPPAGFTPIPPPPAGFTPVDQTTTAATPTPQPSLLQRGLDLASKIPIVQFGIGAVKSAEEGLGGTIEAGMSGSQQRQQGRASALGVENQVPAAPSAPDAADHIGQGIASWLKQNTERQGFIQKSGAAGEIMAELFAPGEIGRVLSLPDKLMEASRTIKAIDTTPALQRLISRAVTGATTAGTEVGAQTYARTGGDPEATAKAVGTAGVVGGIAEPVVGGIGDYLQGLKDQSAALAEPIPEPAYTIRAPAAERFATQEQQAAQDATRASLEDLNQYRQVNAQGTPTNIQQLGLPSRSATEPYQFTVPGWSATSEAGDLLHEAGARYQQAGTRVVEGPGQASLQPWEAQQAAPFDLPRYAETPGATVQTDPPTAPAQPEPIPPAEAATPPETPTISHREPIMQATAYRTGVRPGSDIRQATTVGGPSILTTDPEIAAGHLDQIESIVQDPNFSQLPPQRQMDILQSRNDVMRQMQEYKSLLPQHEYSPYLHQPTFEPVDIEQALARVGDTGDAAEEMMRGPKEMYQRWTNLTKDRPESMGGSFQDLNEEISDLGGKSGAANRQLLAQKQQQMQQMFNGSDPYLGRAGTNIDRAAASAQFSNGYLVKRMDDAFTNAYSGAERSGDFSVSKLQSNWKSLVNDVGSPRLSNVLGPDRYEAMNNMINDMAAEPAADKAAAATYEQQQAARAAAQAKQKWYYDVAKNGWTKFANDAGVGELASIAPKGLVKGLSTHIGHALILKHILMRPAIANLVYRGAQLGTKPALYAPIISDAIRSDLPPAQTTPGGQ